MASVRLEERQWLAVRVAYINCGGNDLSITGSNRLTCRKCHQEQSFFLDLNQSDDLIVTFPAR
ncbi:MAG: hypothetical protein ABSA92_07900 [Candidatus Bathyarchaeia archaeon]